MVRAGSVIFLCILAAAAPATAAAGLPTPATEPGATTGTLQQEGAGRGDDLTRVKTWRTFLDRANRAFFAARLPVSEVEAKIKEADVRIAELEERGAGDKTGRSDITGDVVFLERALRAFTAARMSTTDVQKWLEEARPTGGLPLLYSRNS